MKRELSLDFTYAPKTLEEAIWLLDDLRLRHAALLDEICPWACGMTPMEGKIYWLLKRRCRVSIEQMHNFLYGGADTAPDPKILKVFIHRVRKKLPAGERIEAIYGWGYQFVREAAAT